MQYVPLKYLQMVKEEFLPGRKFHGFRSAIIISQIQAWESDWLKTVRFQYVLDWHFEPFYGKAQKFFSVEDYV